MPPAISIVIPVHNGAERLPGLFRALESQQAPDIAWELIVVDNNSSDATPSVVEQTRRDWRDDVPFLTRVESRQGVGFARQTGVEAASGVWVAFLDDDTRPAPDWIAAAVAFARNHPRAAVLGGRTAVEVPGGVPNGFERLGVYFCERELGNVARTYRPEILELSPGAGMVIRREAWLRHVPSVLGYPTVGGNDLEVQLHVIQGGWEAWYVPSMRLTHEVERERLAPEKLMSLLKTYGDIACGLRLIGKRGWRRLETRIRVLTGSAWRVLKLLLLEGHRLRRDRFCRADLQFWRAAMWSALRPVPPTAPKAATNRTRLLRSRRNAES